MAKKQTRRSISLNRTLFEHAKDVARFEGVSLSSFTERAIRELLSRINEDPITIGRREHHRETAALTGTAYDQLGPDLTAMLDPSARRVGHGG